MHRDIKPANVMLTRAGDVKVMDFGIARALADIGATMTQTSAVIGTAQYLSPEQARGEQVDARSDLYSTGCLLYELLTGRPPFVGDSPVSVAYQHVREEPVPPSHVDPDVPPSAGRDRAQGAGQGPRATATRPPTRCAATSPPRWPAGRWPRCCRRRQHRTQQIPSTTVLPGTSTMPAVGDRSHRDRPRRQGRAGLRLRLARPGRARRVRHRRADRAVAARRRRRQRRRGPGRAGLTVAEARADLQAERSEAGRADPEGTATPSPRATSSTRARRPATASTRAAPSSVTVSTGADGGRRAVAGRALARRGPPGAERGRARARATPTGRLGRDAQHGGAGRARGRARRSRPASKVDLEYASGNNKVPDVVGEDEAEAARNLIEQAGFTRRRSPPRRSRPTPSRAPCPADPGREGDRAARVDGDLHGRDRRRPSPTPTPTADRQPPLPTGHGHARPRPDPVAAQPRGDAPGPAPRRGAGASGSPQVTSQLASSRCPPSVSTDSGWNCTPSSGEVAVPQRHHHAARGPCR